MSVEDPSVVYLRILAEKAEDSLERDHDAEENARRLEQIIRAIPDERDRATILRQRMG